MLPNRCPLMIRTGADPGKESSLVKKLVLVLVCWLTIALAANLPPLVDRLATAQESSVEDEAAEDEAAEDEAMEEAAESEMEEESADAPALEDNMCVQCHGNAEVWEEDTQHLYVGPEHLANDIHWKKGILCQDCHGGDATSTNLRTAHAIEDGFRKIEKPSDQPAFCGHCHADVQYMSSHGSPLSTSIVSDYLKSVHGVDLLQVGNEKSATCTSCHPRHDMRGKSDPMSAVGPLNLVSTCGRCHTEVRDELLSSDHQGVGLRTAEGTSTPLSCLACHAGDPHAMTSVTDLRSSVFAQRQIENCGRCHEQAMMEYWASVHGKGLSDAGLLTTAFCANCHGAHGILKARNPASQLHVTRVAQTCGVCHRLIEDQLRLSVHGGGNGPGGDHEESAAGGTVKRRPSCTDCHQGHALPDPRSAEFRNQESGQCGTCHVELYRGYRLSMHGALTNLGFTAGAKCSDCHGAHDILPLSDPSSRMSPQNRIQTCSACHQGMSPKMASFDPHADHHDAERSPVLYWVYRGVLTFIIVVFGFFGLHAMVWFLRGLVDVWQHGRPRALQAGTPGYVRFRPFHRVAHSVMVVSFLGLALTGLPLKFSDYLWAQWLASILGGFASTGLWHRIFAISMFGTFLSYVGLMTRLYFVARRRGKTRQEALFGPESPLPNLRDARDFAAMVRWFLGRGPRPTFERWAYWEKFDFFGATSDTILIGVSGLILWFPNWFCNFLPGEAVNIAKVVHSTLALLATGFVFAIHFFGTHFRPDKFPMDMSILTGVVSEEEMHHERPEVLERLRREGRLEQLQTRAPAQSRLWAVRIGGGIALVIGLAALAGIIWSLWP